MKNKKPLAVEHKGLVKAKRKAGGLRVQIYGKFRTYTTKNAYYFGGKS